MAANPSLISPLSSGNQRTRNNTFFKKTDVQTENSRTNLPIRITRNQSEAKTFMPRKLIQYKEKHVKTDEDSTGTSPLVNSVGYRHQVSTTMDSADRDNKHLASTATAASKPFGVTSGNNMGATTTAMASPERGSPSPMFSTAHNT